MSRDRRSSPHPAPRTVPAGWGTAVTLGASTALLLFSALTLASTWWTPRASPPAAPLRRAALAPDVDLWVGEVSPGVKAVLSAEWNDPDWDGLQDERWRQGLGLPAGADVAFYALVAFNTTQAPVRLTFPAGAIGIVPAGETLPVGSLDLTQVLAGVGTPGPATATLRSLGADRAEVDLPPGKMLRRPVAFPRRVALAQAETVARTDGSTFHRRRMPRAEWAGLLLAPSLDQVRAL